MGILQQKSVCFEALFLAVKRDNIVFVAVSLVIVFSWRTVKWLFVTFTSAYIWPAL